MLIYITFRVMKMKYERILIYGLKGKVVSAVRSDRNEQVRVSSLAAGDTAYYKMILSDTNAEIEVNQSFELTWELQDE